jgi:hypothetical protein
MSNMKDKEINAAECDVCHEVVYLTELKFCERCCVDVCTECQVDNCFCHGAEEED